jgi:hypothetical protein
MKENPFDRKVANLPLMRLMIHSSSLSNELLRKDSIIHRLIKLNFLKEVEIIALPSPNDVVHQILVDNGLIYTEYYSDNLGVSLKASNGNIYGVAALKPKQSIWYPITQGTTVTLLDITASKICDYLVIDKDDAIFMSNVAKNIIVSPEQALELIRIILVAHGLFYIVPNYTTDEVGYYLYRFKNLFREYQYAWSVAVHAHGKNLAEVIFDHLDSLSRRLEFICMAYDKVAFYSLKTANNDTQDNQLYHLAYFVILITGALDDLAHIIKEFYQLEIHYRMGITLRIAPDKKIPKFYQELQNKINAFYPLRDSIQHRELLRGFLYSANFGDKKNLFEISDEAAKCLSTLPYASDCVVRMHKPSIDAFLFIQWAQNTIIELVNNIIPLIDWDIVYKTLPKDIQDKIRESDESFRQGVGKFLKFGMEPLYF